MAETYIPHAESEFVERGFPKSILHVVTPLAKAPASKDAGPRHDMLVAISQKVAARGLDGYRVHWSDDADAHRT